MPVSSREDDDKGAASEIESSLPAYARSGVDLDHDEAFIDDVKEIVRGTFRPEVLPGEINERAADLGRRQAEEPTNRVRFDFGK